MFLGVFLTTTAQKRQTIHPADAVNVAQAVALLRAGELIGLPTETVYGVAGDACSDSAVARIFALKDRPQFNPLIAHVSEREMAADLVDISDAAARLMHRFWPGPLTIVLPRRQDCPVSLLASAGLDSLALRCPDHPVAQQVITAFDGPLAAPSANPSGRVSPTTAEHVAAGLDLPLILDGGPCRVGLESTIVSLLADTPRLLRPGSVLKEEIETVLGANIRGPSAGPVTAPGQLPSHYAPTLPLRLNVARADKSEAVLAFGDYSGDAGQVFPLSAKSDLTEAAAHLFAQLRAADQPGKFSGIAVTPIPETGLGIAINDRLRRAAAPRDVPREAI